MSKIKNMNRRTLIIAEAGVNHNGDLAMARQLIDVAADAGVDFIKFQTFSAERQVTHTAAKAQYQQTRTGNAESQYAMLKRLELSVDAHCELIDYCLQKNVHFFSTGFDIQSIELLLTLGQKIIKIPSGEITNLPYLRFIGQQGMEVILSTGMSTMQEISDALKVLEDSGTRRDQITVLHCTTEYPAPFEEINLRAMQTIAQAFNVKIGYSDHSVGIEVPIAAVAMGAQVIEKHFTLDRTLPGPDHQASLEPRELYAMVAAIRNVESALGNGVKQVTPSEWKNKDIARKSIVARQAIKLGELFTAENLAAKRPGNGLSPMRWDEVLGMR
ncbi:MAG: N-acetylneuraminate synthase, partial [Burkholderiales bacterium]|nr:N-acetylneuraminate synthase [Burkholderiales bacterium]